jgi:hypothetical protein
MKTAMNYIALQTTFSNCNLAAYNELQRQFGTPSQADAKVALSEFKNARLTIMQRFGKIS